MKHILKPVVRCVSLLASHQRVRHLLAGRDRLLCTGRANYTPIDDELRGARALLGLSTAGGADVDADVQRRAVRDAYYRLAKQCHPDSAAEGRADPTRFRALSEAYDLLRGAARASGDGVGVGSDAGQVQSTSRSRHLWAKLFFGSVEDEMLAERGVVEGLLAAAKLSAGGLDKGGMWALAAQMDRGMRGHELERDPDLLGGCGETQTGLGGSASPKPFTRNKRPV
jgi:hypothetical protein